MIIPVNWANWIASYSFVGDSEPMITTMGVKVSTWGGAYADGLEWISDLWCAALSASLSDEVEMNNYTLQVGQDGGDPISYGYAGGCVGAASSFPMWPNTAVLIQKRSASGGRRNRGRMYVPGLALRSLVTSAGVLDSAWQADFQTNLDNFRTAVNAGTGFEPTDLGVLHSEPPTAPAVITNLQVSSKVATQRRRLRP